MSTEEKAKEVAADVKELAVEVGHDVKDAAHDGVEKAKEIGHDLKEKAVDAADTAKAVGVGLFDAAKAKATEIAEKVTNRDLDGDGKVG